MITTAPPSVGPKRQANDSPVHIIKLNEDPPQAHPHGAPTQGLGEAERRVGKPHPTDIIVFDHQPWHYVNGHLKAHPQVHIDFPETILKVSYSKREQAVWWSEQPFTITAVHPSSHHAPPAGAPPGPPAGVPTPPDNPFDGPQAPYVAAPELDAAGQKTIWLVRANPIKPTAVGHIYKINFNIGEDIDPDMEGTP